MPIANQSGNDSHYSPQNFTDAERKPCLEHSVDSRLTGRMILELFSSRGALLSASPLPLTPIRYRPPSGGAQFMRYELLPETTGTLCG
jgi:hypothetical protein